VVVVGGGVTGCSCALTLAEAGVRVRLHDARRIAAGASGRNGGFALRGAAMPYDEMRDALGPERARALWSLTERALDRIEQLAGDAFRRSGSLRLAADDDEAAALASEFDAIRSDGFDAEWVEVLPPRVASLACAAMRNPSDGSLHPVRWVSRLAARAAAAGADVVEGSRVDPYRVQAATVVIAVDGLTASLVPELAHAVRPVRGQLLVTEPLAERLYDQPHYARHGYDYWQQLPDGRLVVGGGRDKSLSSEQTAVEETTVLIQGHLDALAHTLVGYAPRASHRWAGIWGETDDRLPFAGRIPGRDSAWVAGGYSGHGNVLGFVCGDLVARAILGEQPPELVLFDPARF
jgi:gamma-glutamylputrescine oxidase